MKLAQIVIFSALSSALFAAYGLFLGVDAVLVGIVAVILLAALLRSLMEADL